MDDYILDLVTLNYENLPIFATSPQLPFAGSDSLQQKDRRKGLNRQLRMTELDHKMDTPDTSKLVLRRKKKVKITSFHNSSRLARNNTLNSTLLKQTLKSNNRALARALERVRQELADTQKQLLLELDEKQALQEKYSNLVKVAGLKNDDIENEVRDRMEHRLTEIREDLNKVSGSMLGTVELIYTLMPKCESRYSRGSSIGQRGSSIQARGSSIGLAQGAEVVQQRSMYYHGPRGSNATASGSSANTASGSSAEAVNATADSSVVSSSTEVNSLSDQITPHSSNQGCMDYGGLSMIVEQSGLDDGLMFTEGSDTEDESSTRPQSSKYRPQARTGSRSRFSLRRRSRSSSAVPMATGNVVGKDYTSDSALTEARPKSSDDLSLVSKPALDERPIVSKFAPHIARNTPTNSPAKDQNQSEFFTSFVPLDEGQAAKPTPPLAQKAAPKRKHEDNKKATSLAEKKSTSLEEKKATSLAEKKATSLVQDNKKKETNLDDNKKKVTSQKEPIKKGTNQKADRIQDGENKQTTKIQDVKTKNIDSQDKMREPKANNAGLQEKVGEKGNGKKTSVIEVSKKQGNIKSKLPKRKIIVSDGDSSSGENEPVTKPATTTAHPSNHPVDAITKTTSPDSLDTQPDSSRALRRETFAVDIPGEVQDRRATFSVEKPERKKSKRETFVLKSTDGEQDGGILEEGDSILLDTSQVPIQDEEVPDVIDTVFKAPLPPAPMGQFKQPLPPGPRAGFKEPLPLGRSQGAPLPSRDETIYEPEDMEFTGVIPTIEVLEPVPVPDFITRENSMEPSFLQETSQLVLQGTSTDGGTRSSSRRTRTLSKETVLTLAASKDDDPESDKHSDNKANRRRTRSLGNESERLVKSSSADVVSESEEENSDFDSLGCEVAKRRKTRTLSKEKVLQIEPKSPVTASKPQVEEDILCDNGERKTTDSESSDGEKTKKNFSTFLGKPGKITFKAGRKDMKEIIAKKKKAGIVKKKNKKFVAPSTSPLNASRHGIPKSVFDLTLNESIPVPSSISYGQFVAQKSQAVVPSTSGDVTHTEHGIMLVLGNGKRTKPRRRRSKSVHYAESLAEENLITPALAKVTARTDQDKKCEKVVKNAGHTPPKKPLSESKKKQMLKAVRQSNQALVMEEEDLTEPEEKPAPKRRSSVKKRKLMSIDKVQEPSDDDSPVAPPKERLLVAEKRPGLSHRLPSVFTAESDSETQEDICEDEEPTPEAVVDKCSSESSSKQNREASTDSPEYPRKRKSAQKPNSPQNDRRKNTPQQDSDSEAEREKTSQKTTERDIVLRDISNKKSKEKRNKSMKKTKEQKKKKRDHVVVESDVLLIPDIKDEPASFVEHPDDHVNRESVENMHHQFEDPEEGNGRRSRRGASTVSYKEPTLNSKLRRGDPIAKTVYNGRDAPVVFKNKKDAKKSFGRGESTAKRSALSVITNTVDPL